MFWRGSPGERCPFLASAITRISSWPCDAWPSDVEVNLPATVHSQAISGLPHWGLIRDIDSKCRCQILLLHRAPYSSIPAELVPGQPDAATWIAQSQQWRLAHELTTSPACGWWVKCASISSTNCWPMRSACLLGLDCSVPNFFARDSASTMT